MTAVPAPSTAPSLAFHEDEPAPPARLASAAADRPPEWMTIREISYETRLSETFVRKQLRAGAMPYTTFGSRLRVRRRDYAAWIARRAQATGAQQLDLGPSIDRPEPA